MEAEETDLVLKKCQKTDLHSKFGSWCGSEGNRFDLKKITIKPTYIENLGVDLEAEETGLVLKKSAKKDSKSASKTKTIKYWAKSP